MFVCLSARISQRLHAQTSQDFLCMLSWAVARSSSDDNGMCYVLPVLWMTSCFLIMALWRVVLAISTWAPCWSQISNVFARVGTLFEFVVVYNGSKWRSGAKSDAYDCLVALCTFFNICQNVISPFHDLWFKRPFQLIWYVVQRNVLAHRSSPLWYSIRDLASAQTLRIG